MSSFNHEKCKTSSDEAQMIYAAIKVNTGGLTAGSTDINGKRLMSKYSGLGTLCVLIILIETNNLQLSNILLLK